MLAETGPRVEIQPTVSFSIFNERNTEASRDAAAGGSTYLQVLFASSFFAAMGLRYFCYAETRALTANIRSSLLHVAFGSRDFKS